MLAPTPHACNQPSTHPAQHQLKQCLLVMYVAAGKQLKEAVGSGGLLISRVNEGWAKPVLPQSKTPVSHAVESAPFFDPLGHSKVFVCNGLNIALKAQNLLFFALLWHRTCSSKEDHSVSFTMRSWIPCTKTHWHLSRFSTTTGSSGDSASSYCWINRPTCAGAALQCCCSQQ